MLFRSVHLTFTDENAVQTILDLLVGAIEPTTNALNSAIFLVSSTPVVQKKLQDEIDTVVGHFHPSSVNDRLKYISFCCVNGECEHSLNVT